MHESSLYSGNREEDYPLVIKQLEALCEDEPNLVANLANASALLADYLKDVNWVGFYLWDREAENLVLGPFQGKAACIRIGLGKGVCGTALAQKRTQLVPDVHAFPGHIACDSASLSEIVVPLFRGGQALGVLDIDSPLPARFDETDKLWLEAFAKKVEPLFDRA